MSEPGLRVFVDPASVAVVGASNDRGKWGHWLASGALRGLPRRNVYLINRRQTNVCGVPVYPDLAALPETPELVVLCIPAASVPGVVDQGLRSGVRGFLIITAGVADDAGLAARITAAGARLLGPNCLGVHDSNTELHLTWGSFLPGRLGIVSQSGQLGSEIASLAESGGTGISRLLSLGNQADVAAAEAVRDLVRQPETQVIALYLEDFTHGRALAEAMVSARNAGKPVLVLTVGEAKAARSAAHSHTGALASSRAVVDAACRAAGALLLRTPSELADAATMLLHAPAPKGARLAVVGDSGGQAALAVDLAENWELRVPPLTSETVAGLAAELPAEAHLSNPVDLAGRGESDLHVYARILRMLAASGEVDMLLLTGYFGCYGAEIGELAESEREVAEQIVAISRARNLPVLVHSMGERSPTLAVLRDGGVPVFPVVERAVTAAATAATHSGRQARLANTPAGRRRQQPVGVGYWAARSIASSVGIRFPAAEPVRNPEEIERATEQLNAPYVVKADWLAHKSDYGGVAVDLRDKDQVRTAFEKLSARLGPGKYVLEEMDSREDVVEFLVGIRRDPAFGPVVLVGAGGVQAELLADTATELAPVDVPVALGMIRRLRAHGLLTGRRGSAAANADSLARLVAEFSHVLFDYPEVSGIELNPVRVGAHEALAVDALVSYTRDGVDIERGDHERSG